MGQKYFKPKKNNFKNQVISNTKPEITEEKDNDYTNHYNNIISVVNRLLQNIRNTESGINIEDDLISKSARKRPISHNKHNHTSKFQKLEFKDKHIKLFTDVYSMNELIEYLHECSNSESSSIPVTDFEDIETPIRDKFIDGSMKEVEKLLSNLSNLNFLLNEEKIHLELAGQSEYFKKLELIMNMAAKQGLITDIIDLHNNEKNSALSIALLNGNLQAFCFLLLVRKAEIPKFIYINGYEQSFLIYIALHGKIAKKNCQIEYLLIPVLKDMEDRLDNESIYTHLITVDSNLKICLPHLLLVLFQSHVDLRDQINECLYLCIKMCPTIYEVQCISYFCPNYLFDLIAHCIILPITNERVLEELLSLEISALEKKLYKDLCTVHRDPIKLKRLMDIIG